MESLIEKLKQAGDESFEIWFDRWYEKCDWEHNLTIIASKGQNGTFIAIYKKEEYTKNRLLDERFIHKMKKMLGAGIEVSLKVETRKSAIFGSFDERFILIKW